MNLANTRVIDTRKLGGMIVRKRVTPEGLKFETVEHVPFYSEPEAGPLKPVAAVIRAVEDVLLVRGVSVMSKRRTARIVFARLVVAYVLLETFGVKPREIARQLDYACVSSVHYARRTIRDRINLESNVRRDVALVATEATRRVRG